VEEELRSYVVKYIDDSGKPEEVMVASFSIKNALEGAWNSIDIFDRIISIEETTEESQEKKYRAKIANSIIVSGRSEEEARLSARYRLAQLIAEGAFSIKIVKIKNGEIPNWLKPKVYKSRPKDEK